jgi:molybdenum cofactor cytidylyltransferase
MKNIPEPADVTAIVLAAGLSSRMKDNKLLLPWGKVTVIEWVVSQLINAGLNHIIVVTGRDKEKVEELTSLPGILHIYNKRYTDGEMLHSLQCGIEALPLTAGAALVALGDQPQIEVRTINCVMNAYQQSDAAKLVLPSFHNRRGHPWVVGRELWGEILDMEPPDNLRTFMNQHSSEIHYIVVDSDSILADIDTPADYHDAVRSSSR